MVRRDFSNYKNFYKFLIRLYPGSFQRRFAEPMLQTFGDMCQERLESGESLKSFAIRIYAETFLQIIKEQMKEVVMNTKNINKRMLLVVGGATVLLIAGVIIAVVLNSGNNVIKPGSTIEQAKEQSAGNKQSCLPNDDAVAQQIIDTEPVNDLSEEVKNDPDYTPTMYFDFVLLSGIIDVPAGTYADVTFNSFQDDIAKGSANYESDYGDYNYEMKYLGQPGEWELVSLIACE